MGPNQNSSQPSVAGMQPTQTPSFAPKANPTPVAPTSPASVEPAKEGNVGALIGSIIIVIIIVLGGLYFWGKMLEKQNKITPGTSNQTSVLEPVVSNDLSATALTKLPPSNSLSASDEVTKIEAALSDLQSMNSSSDLASLGE